MVNPTGALHRPGAIPNRLGGVARSGARADELGGRKRLPLGNQASFDSRNYGYATLTKLLKATDLFQLDKEGTSEVSVRDIRQARAPKP